MVKMLTTDPTVASDMTLTTKSILTDSRIELIIAFFYQHLKRLQN